GATSGIGLATARHAVRQGARVVLTGRSEGELQNLVREFQGEGGEAAQLAADVADLEALRGVARFARDRFGGLDTWVNNAGVSIYGQLLDVALDDARRLFDTNYWGIVHGSIVACEHFKSRPGTSTSGALINIGSVLSDA